MHRTAHPRWAVNINYVYGLKDDAAQTWMPPLAWLGFLMFIVFPTIYVATHFLLKALFT